MLRSKGSSMSASSSTAAPSSRRLGTRSKPSTTDPSHSHLHSHSHSPSTTNKRHRLEPESDVELESEGHWYDASSDSDQNSVHGDPNLRQAQMHSQLQTQPRPGPGHSHGLFSATNLLGAQFEEYGGPVMGRKSIDSPGISAAKHHSHSHSLSHSHSHGHGHGHSLSHSLNHSHSLNLSNGPSAANSLLQQQQHNHQKTKILLGMKRSSAAKLPIAPQPTSMSMALAVGMSYGQALFEEDTLTALNSSSSAAAGSSAAALAKDKGLRHFSAKVCAKVEEKGCTTYNEVADELVREIGLELGKFDHKNIRRRVYDALNVLMAIDCIRKDKKEIRWLGLPNEAADDLRDLEAERAALQHRVAEKSRSLREILRRCISLKNLIDRNAALERCPTTSASTPPSDRLHLPFILISAAPNCHVHCEMLEDRTQYFFEFTSAFQINEDIELMRLMGLDTARVEQIRREFPKELVAHVLMLCLSQGVSVGSVGNEHRPIGTMNTIGAFTTMSSHLLNASETCTSLNSPASMATATAASTNPFAVLDRGHPHSTLF